MAHGLEAKTQLEECTGQDQRDAEGDEEVGKHESSLLGFAVIVSPFPSTINILKGLSTKGNSPCVDLQPSNFTFWEGLDRFEPIDKVYHIQRDSSLNITNRRHDQGEYQSAISGIKLFGGWSTFCSRAYRMKDPVALHQKCLYAAMMWQDHIHLTST